MTIKKENNLWIGVITSLILFYFIWLFVWNDQDLVRAAGGSLFSIIGTLIPSVWLWGAVRSSSSKNEQIYWSLLFSGTFSYFLAEIFWFYADILLPGEVSYPGLYDLFYIGSVLYYFLAFIQRIWKFGNKSMMVKLGFDIATTMTVSISFSWYYLLAPLIDIGDVSFLALAVTLFYPIGDILLLFCAAVFYFAGTRFFKRQTVYSILLGLSVQIIADSVYFFEIVQDTYLSGNWIDPLFILPIMLIGYTALSEKETELEHSHHLKELVKEPLSTMRLMLPYLLVVFLFIFTMVKSDGIDSLSVGSGISIGFIILRQFIVISENRKLMKQYHNKAEELQLSEERYKSLYQYNPDSVFSFDLAGKIENVNQAGVNLMERDRNALIGLSITDFVDKQHREKLIKDLEQVKKGSSNPQELEIHHKNGKEIWVNITHIPILVKNKLVGIFGIGKDITENKLNVKRIQFYAYHDYLTGLANRMLFEENLNQAILSAEKSQTSLAILFLDLNKFKEINDTFGHDTGDQLLMALADRIKDFAGDRDLAARLGGDEFTILIEDISDPNPNIQEDIATLSKLLSTPYIINDTEIICTASIGAAYYPIDGTTPSALLSKADHAMYRVKREGQGEVTAVLFDQ